MVSAAVRFDRDAGRRCGGPRNRGLRCSGIRMRSCRTGRPARAGFAADSELAAETVVHPNPHERGGWAVPGPGMLVRHGAGRADRVGRPSVLSLQQLCRKPLPLFTLGGSWLDPPLCDSRREPVDSRDPAARRGHLPGLADSGGNSNRAADTCSVLSRNGKAFPGASGPPRHPVAALHLRPLSVGRRGGLPPGSGSVGRPGELVGSGVRSCARPAAPRAVEIGNRAAVRSGGPLLC